jgi:hypothetical protein
MNPHQQDTTETCLSGALEGADLVIETVVVQVEDAWGDNAGLGGTRAVDVPVIELD